MPDNYDELLKKHDEITLKLHLMELTYECFMRGMDHTKFEIEENTIFMKNITIKAVEKILKNKRMKFT